MPLALVPLTRADTLSWTRVRAQAYLGPTHELVHSGPISEDSILKVAEDRKREVGRPNTWHWKIVDTDLAPSDGDPDDNGGKTIAIAVWSAHNIEERKESSNDKPSSPAAVLSAYRKDEAPPFLPPELRLDVLDALFRPLRDAQKSIMGERPYFMLNSLATLDEHRGRGCGTLLLEWGLKRADELGLETYLDGTKIARPLYEKNGFVLVKGMEFDRTPWGGEGIDWHGCMVRKPNAKVEAPYDK